MDLAVLRDELTNDPLGRGYSGMTDAEAATDLNEQRYTAEIEEVSSAWVYERIDTTEFDALLAEQKVDVRDILALGSGIDATSGSRARATIVSAFGGGSTTVSTMATDLEYPQSRADQIGLGEVRDGDVETARNMT